MHQLFYQVDMMIPFRKITVVFFQLSLCCYGGAVPVDTLILGDNCTIMHGQSCVITVDNEEIVFCYYSRHVDGQFSVGLATTRSNANNAGTRWLDYGTVLEGDSGGYDEGYAAFPGVWYDEQEQKIHLVYEAFSTGHGVPHHRICYAWSDFPAQQGVEFTKWSAPILEASEPWEAGGIGTPNLYRENGVWYCYYHGNDASKDQINEQCVATGSTLTKLKKFPGNPILPVIPGTWQSHSVGEGRLFVRDGLYYMAYEGCHCEERARRANGFFDQRQCGWTWSLAVTDELERNDWFRHTDTHIGPPQLAVMAYDGPMVMQFNHLTYIYYRGSEWSEAHQTWKTERMLIECWINRQLENRCE
jgi:hypothetical protein